MGPEQRETRPFNIRMLEEMREAFRKIFLRYPEVTCLTGIATLAGELNDTGIPAALWLSAGTSDEAVVAPSEILGSIHQTLGVLAIQMGRAVQLRDHLRDQIIALQKEALAREQERKPAVVPAAVGQEVGRA
jgi:hypothetical protein